MNHIIHNNIVNFIWGIANQHTALCQTSGEAFYNLSPFTLLDLKNRAKQHRFKADIYALEQETEGLLEQIVGEAE